MTVGDFFETIGNNPSVALFWFIGLPLTAFLCSAFGKGEGHLSPWKETYCFIVYAACIPGILALIFNVYKFLFERGSIMEANLYTQILPIISMLLTLWLVRRNVCWEDIPGFGKLGGLMLILVAIISFMWILDRMRIFVISVWPFHYFLILFLVLLFLIRIGWKRMST